MSFLGNKITKKLGIVFLITTICTFTGVNLDKKKIPIFEANQAHAGEAYPSINPDSDLPAGIASCRDGNLRYAYRLIDDRHTGDGKRAVSDMLAMTHIPGEYTIKSSTVFVEPTLIIAMLKYNQIAGYYEEVDIRMYQPKVKDKNPYLFVSNETTIKFWEYWIDRESYIDPTREEKKIEEGYLKAMFMAVYETPQIAFSKVNEYLGSDLSEREKMIRQVLDRASKMKFNRNSFDPKDGYNRLRTLAHCSKWLSDHYSLLIKKRGDLNHKNLNIINKGLEIPLRDLDPTFIMRGEKKYTKYL